MLGIGLGLWHGTRPGGGGTPTPTPTPAPAFTIQPSISPGSGTEDVTLFTANDGAASNATGYTRRWLLSGTVIGTGTTITPADAGSLVLEVTATGPGGSTVANSAAVTVGGAWSYARSVAVNNTGGSAKSDYPVRVDLTSANFDFTHARSAGEDLRFQTLGGTAIPHWIEAWNSVSQTATVWAKAPTVSAGSTTTLRMLHGNAAAPQASSIASTFIFGEDFSDPLAIVRLPDATPTAGFNVAGVVLGNRTQITAASGVSSTWNQTVREQSNVVYDAADSDPAKRYKLYYTGQTLPSDTGARRIGLAYSPDGRAWTDHPSNPIIGNGTSERAEDPYIVRNIDGTLYRDPLGKMHMFSEDQGQLDTLHWTSTDGIAWTADPANPVVERGVAGSYDDLIVASPVVIHLGGDNKFIMMYEARTSTVAVGQPGYETAALARATSLNGKVWTKSPANPVHSGDVPDELIFTGTQWVYLYHQTSGPMRRAATTVLNPDNWDASSFTDLEPNPISGASIGSYNAAPEGASRFGRQFTAQPVSRLTLDLFDVIGSDAWEFTIPSSAVASPYSAKVSTVGALVLDPNYTSGTDLSLVAQTKNLTLTTNFEVMARRKAIARGTDDQVSQIGIGTGSATVAVNNETFAFMQDSYIFTTLNPGVTNELHLRKYTGAVLASTTTATLSVAESENYAVHKVSYLANGRLVYTVGGSVKYDITDTTHLAKTKQVLLSQGTRTISNPRIGAEQSIDWIAVRPFDGVDPTVTVGAEMPA